MICQFRRLVMESCYFLAAHGCDLAAGPRLKETLVSAGTARARAAWSGVRDWPLCNLAASAAAACAACCSRRCFTFA